MAFHPTRFKRRESILQINYDILHSIEYYRNIIIITLLEILISLPELYNFYIYNITSKNTNKH